jgi:hypothetical protein
MAVEVLNPEGLSSNPAYAQGTVASGRRTVVVGGQSGVDRAWDHGGWNRRPDRTGTAAVILQRGWMIRPPPPHHDQDKVRSS